MLDDDLVLSGGETSDEEGVGISSYLDDSNVDPNTVLSMSRVVAPDLPSSKVITSYFMNGKKDTSEDQSSLIVGVISASLNIKLSIN